MSAPAGTHRPATPRRMSPKDRGRAAMCLIHARIRREGFPVDPQVRRELGHIARVSGVSIEELQVFAWKMMFGLMAGVYGVYGSPRPMPAMTRERECEIAVELFKHELRKHRIPVDSSVGRKLINASRETGLPLSELTQFVRELSEELVAEAFVPRP